MRHLTAICLAGFVGGLALCDAWSLSLVVVVAAAVAYGVARAVAERGVP